MKLSQFLMRTATLTDESEATTEVKTNLLWFYEIEAWLDSLNFLP